MRVAVAGRRRGRPGEPEQVGVDGHHALAGLDALDDLYVVTIANAETHHAPLKGLTAEHHVDHLLPRLLDDRGHWQSGVLCALAGGDPHVGEHADPQPAFSIGQLEQHRHRAPHGIDQGADSGKGVGREQMPRGRGADRRLAVLAGLDHAGGAHRGGERAPLNLGGSEIHLPLLLLQEADLLARFLLGGLVGQGAFLVRVDPRRSGESPPAG
jgi:hypothetical protein